MKNRLQTAYINDNENVCKICHMPAKILNFTIIFVNLLLILPSNMINAIAIENYKSIKELNLPMRPINVLIGANGAGKSNFVGFFKFLKDIYERNLQRHVADEGSAEDILHFGSKNSDHILGRIMFEGEQDIANGYEFTLRPNADGKLYFDVEYALFQLTKKYAHPHYTALDSKHNESRLSDSSNRVAAYVKQYMSSFRVFHFHDTSKTAKMRKPANINDNSFLREDGSNLPAYLYWLQQVHPKSLQKIEMGIRAIAPYFEQFNLHPDRINEEQIRLEWREKGSDAYFNAKHLSDGTLRFIALSTLLLQPTPPEVIIVDEPELGLHPFAIGKLAGLIKKAATQTQVIISTQSVNLVDNFSPEDVITVDRKDAQSVFTRCSSEELKDWLAEYSISDLWRKNVIGGRP